MKKRNIKLEIEGLGKLEGVWTPSDIVEPPVVKPPVVVPPSDGILDLDEFLEGKEGIVELPKEVKKVRSKGMIKPNKVKALIGNQKVNFKSWDETPDQIFDLIDHQGDFGIRGINFLTPSNRLIKTAPPDKSVFGWERDKLKSGRFAYIDAPIETNQEQMTFGLCRFGYSSNDNQRIFLIGENLRHNGFNFTQIKNPYKGNLWLVLKDVYIHNPIEIDVDDPNAIPCSMFYAPTSIKVRVRMEEGKATIVSNNTFDQIRTWLGYKNGFVRSLLYVGNQVWNITDEQVSDDSKTLYFGDEFQVGEIVSGEKVIKKQINHVGSAPFSYEWTKTNEPDKIIDLKGEHDAYLIYKGNAVFNNHRLAENTPFGDIEVRMSHAYGYSWYNQEFSGYLENVNGKGYFRKSTGSQRTQGLTIRDCDFQKNGPKATANEEYPQEAKEFVDWLRSV